MYYFNVMNFLDHPFDMPTFLRFISAHLPSTISSTLAGALHVKSASDLEAFLLQLSGSVSGNSSQQTPRRSIIKDRVVTRKVKPITTMVIGLTITIVIQGRTTIRVAEVLTTMLTNTLSQIGHLDKTTKRGG